MKNLLEELQQLDTNDPGSWSAVHKASALAILLIAILVAGYFFDWQEQQVTLDKSRAEEETLKQAFLIKKRSAVNLETLRQQLVEIEQSLSALLKQLPDKSEMEALLIDINQAGLGRGLQFELFKPATSETTKDFYAELPIDIRVTGNYHDISAFSSDVAQLSRIVTLDDIHVMPNKEGSLVLDAVARTYRFLDEDEIADISGEVQ